MLEEIRDYIFREILEEEVAIDPDTRLYSSSLISSMKHLKLINYLERKYDVSLPMREIRMDNFDTVSHISAFIRKKQNSGNV